MIVYTIAILLYMTPAIIGLIKTSKKKASCEAERREKALNTRINLFGIISGIILYLLCTFLYFVVF